MKAILIDPCKRTVTYVEYDNDYKSIYKLIDCEVFTALTVNREGDALYLDDEALINGTDKTPFIWRGYDAPLLGKALLTGVDDDGNTVEPTIDLEYVRSQVIFFERAEHENGDAYWRLKKAA